MEIFVDSANIAEIKNWTACGVIDGVTTNPTIIFNEGIHDLRGGVEEIAATVYPRPVSVEVTTNDLSEMVDQARDFAGWASNIVIKIPIINEDGVPCLEVIRRLEEEGIRVNVTACLSFGQVVLAAKAGATYVSIFAGRVWDEGHDAARLISVSVAWLERWKFRARIIVGSMREVINIQEAAVAGAHIITLPPKLLPKLVDHKYSRETVRGFVRDGKKVHADLTKIRA